jgi:hypothetical protein
VCEREREMGGEPRRGSRVENESRGGRREIKAAAEWKQVSTTAERPPACVCVCEREREMEVSGGEGSRGRGRAEEGRSVPSRCRV